MKKRLLIALTIIIICSFCAVLTGCTQGGGNGHSHLYKDGICECGAINGTESATACDDHQFVNDICTCGTIKPTSGLSYKLSNDGKYYIVTGSGSFDGSYLSIPTTYEGKPVKEIDDNAFEYCDNLFKVMIGDTIVNIGEEAFIGCSEMLSVTIGKSVSSIGGWAFEDCSSLEEVHYTDSINKWVRIEFNSFMSNPLYAAKKLLINGEVLTNISISTATTISNYAFYGNDSLVKVSMGNGVKNIGESAFGDCSNLTNITMGVGVENIGNQAFKDCSSLTTVRLYDGVTTIGENSFENCSALSSITIPDTVTSIGAYAFYGCSSITDLTIPNGVTTVNNNTFENCSSLINLVIGNGVTSIGTNVLTGCVKIKNLTIPFTGAKEDSKTNPHFGYLFGALNYEKQSTTIPNTLETVTVTNTDSIVDYAFYKCSYLKKVILGETVKSIGNNAFYDCTRLDKVEMTDALISIGQKAFYQCFAIDVLELGNGVESIGESAFHNCTNLNKIIMPKSVKNIARMAFYNCTAISEIYYDGNSTNWDGISIVDNNNDCLLNATRYYYTEAEPVWPGNYWHYLDGVITKW